MNDVTRDTMTRTRNAAQLQVLEEINPALPRLMTALESNSAPVDVPEWLLVGSCAAIRLDGSLCWDTLKGILAAKTLIEMGKAWHGQGVTLFDAAAGNGLDLLTFTREAWAGLEMYAPAGAIEEAA